MDDKNNLQAVLMLLECLFIGIGTQTFGGRGEQRLYETGAPVCGDIRHELWSMEISCRRLIFGGKNSRQQNTVPPVFSRHIFQVWRTKIEE